MPVRTEATFRIVTPMFLGGADLKPVDHVPAPSVKGALRFWWRAMNWPRIRAGTDSVQKALADLHTEEAKLFGLAARGEQGGQGKFLLKVKPDKLARTSSESPPSPGAVHPELARCDGALYLGYGLMHSFTKTDRTTGQTEHKKGQLVRGCINEFQPKRGGIFTLQLLSHEVPDNSLIDALKAFGLFGALGSRARHGFGSVCLQSLHINGEPAWSAPNDKASYISAVREVLAGRLRGENPPFSAFSRHSRADLLCSSASPYEVLDTLGKQLMTYRAWGRGGKLQWNAKPDQKFGADHDWYKDSNHGKAKAGFHPQRCVFGLPHNYFGSQKGLDVRPDKPYNRRASPLFFHVHAIGELFIGTSLCLPAEFLPEGISIYAGGNSVKPNIEWSLLDDLLDGDMKYPPTPGPRARFPNRQAILP